MRKVAGTILIFALWLCLTQDVTAVEPPYAAAIDSADTGLRLSWHYPGINRVQLIHDQGEPEFYFFVSESVGDNRSAKVFPEPPTSSAIEQVSVYLWGEDRFPEQPGDPTSPFGLDLFSARPDSATMPLWSSVANADSVPESGAWLDIPVRQALPAADSLWLQLRWLRLTPTAPLVGIDFTGQTTTHSLFAYVEGEQIDWRPYYGAEFLMQLTLTRCDTLWGVDRPDLLPDSFVVYLTSIAAESAAEDTISFAVSDSMHCELELGGYRTCSVAISAWKNGIESEHTQPLELAAPELLSSPLELITQTVEETLEPDEQYLSQIKIKNLWSDSIVCSAAVEDSDWLHITNSPLTLAPQQGGAFDLLFSAENLSPSDYSGEVVIRCNAAGFLFEETVVPINMVVEEPTAVADPLMPTRSRSHQLVNFPNPCNNGTTILAPNSEPIHIYDILGRKVAILRQSVAGNRFPFHFRWNTRTDDGRELPSGIYFYRQEGCRGTGKMLLIK